MGFVTSGRHLFRSIKPMLFLHHRDKNDPLRAWARNWGAPPFRTIKQMLFGITEIRMIQRELPRSPFTTYRNVLPQCACSFDKNKGLSAAGAQTVRTHCFCQSPRPVLAFGLANVMHSALASAGERSGTTNTLLSEAASSKRIESHLARKNKYV